MDVRGKPRIRKLIALLLFAPLLSAPPASATVVGSSGTVIQIISYPEFGAGDFVFRLSSYPPGCGGGFWPSPSQAGFKTTVAVILQARARGQSITVGGNDAAIWTGSNSPFCKVEWVVEVD